MIRGFLGDLRSATAAPRPCGHRGFVAPALRVSSSVWQTRAALRLNVPVAAAVSSRVIGHKHVAVPTTFRKR